MLRTLASLALLLALTAPSLASDCAMTTAEPEVDSKLVSGATGSARVYVDGDCDPLIVTCDFISVWIYEETNGIDGLQRRDEVRDDTCGGRAGPGDTIRF